MINERTTDFNWKFVFDSQIKQTMFTKITQIFIFVLLLGVKQSLAQTSLEVSCTLWDSNTGIDLKSTIYGVKKGIKTKMAVSDNNQRLYFKPNIDLDSFIFVSSGFKELEVPVNFIGKFNEKSTIQFGISDSGNILQGNTNPKVYLIFSYPNTYKIGTDYELHQVRNGKYHFVTNLSNIFEKKQSVVLPLNENLLFYEYIITIKSKLGELLYEKKFFAKKGLNILDCNFYDSLKGFDENIVAKTSNPSKNILSDLGIREIYFSQSNYELKSEYFTTLDSVANYLIKNPNSSINVMGFTDNIGDKKLNTTLAEYRAKVVANYLINKGIGEKRINLKWQDSSFFTTNEIDNSKLSELRKVIISENK